MDWVGQAAAWLRETLAHPWLDAWQPTIAATPDWALLAAGPAFLALLGLALLTLRATTTKRPSGQPITTAPARSPAALPPEERGSSAESATAQTCRSAQTTLESAPRPIPPDDDNKRSVRVFVSSTFMDMQRERDILVKEVFPDLRARMRARGVEVFEVDLRWGITREQQERGETLPILLSEINRCRPYFVGLLGTRYGWVPPADAVTEELKATYPAIAHAAGASVTAMEIMHGVLSDEVTAARALFFERDPAWDWIADLTPDEQASVAVEADVDRAKLTELKAAIRAKIHRVKSYKTPGALGPAVRDALGAAIDAEFPEMDAPDAFEQDLRLHRAYSRERRGIHVGAGLYRTALDEWMRGPDNPPLLVTGASGGGKSTLIANWVHDWREANPRDIVFEHYLGASPDSADPRLLMRRLWEYLNRATRKIVDLPAGDVELMALSKSLGLRIAAASEISGREGAKILIALDGLDKLSSGQDLEWLLDTPHARLLASSLDSDAKEAAVASHWVALNIEPLRNPERSEFVERTLADWGRQLPPPQVQAILASALSGNPLFLKTVLGELRVSATHAKLQGSLGHYLEAADLPDLFARVLERLEADCEPGLVAAALPLIWASRGGLEETEIINIAQATPLAWATLRNNLGDSLRDQLGRITFSHDFLRQAVERRYLGDAESQRATHAILSDQYLSEFAATASADAMTAEEEIAHYAKTVDDKITFLRKPWKRCATELLFHLQNSGRWNEVARCLADEVMFSALPPSAYGSDWDHGQIIADRDALSPGALLKMGASERTQIALAIGQAFAGQARLLKRRADAFPKSGRGEALGMPTWAETAKTLKRDDPQQFGFFRDVFYSFKRLALLADEWALMAWDGTAVTKAALRRFMDTNGDVSNFLRLLTDHGREMTGLSGALEDNPSDWARELLGALSNESAVPSTFYGVDLSEVVQHITSFRKFAGRSVVKRLAPSALIAGQRPLIASMLSRAIESVAQRTAPGGSIGIDVVHTGHELQATVSTEDASLITGQNLEHDYNLFICKLIAKLHGLDARVNTGGRVMRLVFEVSGK